jgi:hypothetical protein
MLGEDPMLSVRIYQPSKSAMQSGKANTKVWYMTFEPIDPLLPESIMGWTSSEDMSQELRLVFSSLGKAIEFARLKGFLYTISNPTKIDFKPKNYGENFTCPRIRGG